MTRLVSSDQTRSGGAAMNISIYRRARWVGSEILPGMLAPLLAEHPDLEMVLVLSNRNEDLLYREADFAVRMPRPVQAGLVARKIADVRIGLFAHARYLAARGTPQRMPDFAGHVLIGPHRDSMALAALAEAGIGALQAGIARARPEQQPVLEKSLSFSLECWLAMHEDLRSSTRVLLVADHLTGHLPAASRRDRRADQSNASRPAACQAPG